MDEVELEFRRFSKEKQEQVRQLVAYTTLMGLTGKDLVSIGGKLDRIEKKKEATRNFEIGSSYAVVPVGKSLKDRELNKHKKWYWTDSHGTKWRFDRDYTWSVDVTNCSTNKRKHFYLDDCVGSHRLSGFVANTMYQVHIGRILLNF